MSERYPGGFITKDTPVTTQSSAPGVWTLDQAMQATRGGNWPVNAPFYIEDVFSTWLYTGTGSALTITNGIDLAGRGGLVWTKARSAANRHALVDTVQGGGFELASNLTNASNAVAPATTFSATGYTMNDSATSFNQNGTTYASWTFERFPKFFDVVTYTGNGANRTIAHNLGSTPGCIIVKKTSGADNWMVYHRSVVASDFLMLNTTNAAINSAAVWNSTAPTSTVFSVGTDTSVNQSGATYVAYLFAHNAGGFGLTGTDNVISCGSLTMDGSGNPASVTLGYEPQMVIVKRTDSTSNWYIEDNMRGLPVTGNGAQLYANTAGAEAAQNIAYPNATGFTWNIGIPSATYIYIAIRRGPMRVPTTGTSVFSPVARTVSTGTVVTTNFPVDLQITCSRPGGDSDDRNFFDRLRGLNSVTTGSNLPRVRSVSTAAEVTNIYAAYNYGNTGYTEGTYYNGVSSVFYNMRRAPGFFDEVCYTGTGSARTVTHNLAAVPELMIVKSRSSAIAWGIYSNALGNNASLAFNANAVNTPSSAWNTTTPTSTVFSLGTASAVNASGDTYVAYLFASCPGVSKVGSYTGTGSTQTINCGFTGGARFVLIKATSTTGDWYVWDSARGIVAGNDPYLTLNTTNAEVTTTDWVDTAATGFELSNAGGNLANSNGVSYIFLAIA